jgi:large subunit ribosomal protein L15
LNTIEEMCDTWITDGVATKKGKVISLNLQSMGYDKLLSTGSTKQSYKLTINAASAKAVEKIEAAGGEILNG